MTGGVWAIVKSPATFSGAVSTSAAEGFSVSSFATGNVQPAGGAASIDGASHVRVATKYPGLTRRHFEAHGIQAECVKLNGAMEIAPAVGLAGRIVDLVESGRTLVENGLVETATIMEVSARLIVNRAALKTDPRVFALVERFREFAA